jgi:hypothetical protein
MFDYDARPVTPQVVIVGRRASSAGYQLRDFLSRNGIPYDWVEIDDTTRVRALLDTSDIGPDRLPPRSRFDRRRSNGCAHRDHRRCDRRRGRFGP